MEGCGAQAAIGADASCAGTLRPVLNMRRNTRVSRWLAGWPRSRPRSSGRRAPAIRAAWSGRP